MPVKNIVFFNDSGAKFVDVGGKGINLIKLKNNNFEVPDGFVVSTSLYREFLRQNNLVPFLEKNLQSLDTTSFEELTNLSERIRSKFNECELSEKDEIFKYFQQMKLAPVAVRSSATAEDLPGLSFAGQHDTFLNIIDEKELERAIINCFSSVYTARAIQYRAKNGVDQIDIANAVIVQKMVHSKFSGVTFTANPVDGNRDEVIIEAIMGLGEALVSGMVEPDTYTVDVKGQEYKIKNKKIGNQEKYITYKDGGGTKIIEKSFSTQLLDNNLILQLAKIAKKIEVLYNSPQDIEWGIIEERIYILQSRAITTLFPISEKLLQEGNQVLISFNALQGVMTPFTPIGADFLLRFVHNIPKTFNFSGEFETQNSLHILGNRIWINVSPALNHPIGKKVIPRALTVAEPETGKILSQLMEEKVIGQSHGKPNFGTIQRMQRLLGFFVNRIRLLYKNPDKERRNKLEKADKFIEYIQKQSELPSTIYEKISFLEFTINLIPKFLFIDLAPFIAGAMSSLVWFRRTSGIDELGYDYLEYTRSVPNNPTTTMNLYLWDIAKIIKNDEKSLKFFNQNSVESLTNTFISKGLPEESQTQIEKFLQKYGFRGYSEIDIGQPRWQDDPTAIISHIKTYLSIENPEHFPDVVFNKGREDAKKLYLTLYDNLSNKRGPKLKLRMFNVFATRHRKLMGMREYPKFIWVKTFGILRSTLLEIGRDLVNQDKITEKEDIFFLNLNLLENYETIDLKLRVELEKAIYEKERKRDIIPRVILGNGQTILQARQTIKLKEGQVLGSPVSPGVVEGFIRVMLSPDEGTLQPGEILVCPATDPSWTPLFQIASGLIMEVGGMMTHGSVVAREHGIPGIVGVTNATKNFVTGQKLRMDGSSGLIEFID